MALPFFSSRTPTCSFTLVTHHHSYFEKIRIEPVLVAIRNHKLVALEIVNLCHDVLPSFSVALHAWPQINDLCFRNVLIFMEHIYNFNTPPVDRQPATRIPLGPTSSRPRSLPQFVGNCTDNLLDVFPWDQHRATSKQSLPEFEAWEHARRSIAALANCGSVASTCRQGARRFRHCPVKTQTHNGNKIIFQTAPLEFRTQYSWAQRSRSQMYGPVATVLAGAARGPMAAERVD